MKELKENNQKMYKINIYINILMFLIYTITTILIVNILKQSADTLLLSQFEIDEVQMYNIYTEPSLLEYILKGMMFASVIIISIPVFQSYLLIKSVIYSKAKLYKRSRFIIKVVISLNTISLLLAIIIQGLSYNGSQLRALPLWIVEIIGIILLMKVKKNESLQKKN